MIAEYAGRYGHLPDPEMDWPLFVSLTKRAERAWARVQLLAFDSVRSAIGAALSGEKNAGEVERRRQELVDLAFPHAARPRELEFVENVFAKPGEEVGHG